MVDCLLFKAMAEIKAAGEIVGKTKVTKLDPLIPVVLWEGALCLLL